MKKIFVVLLMLTATSYASEVARLSIDNGNYTLELPYLELVMPNDAYTAVLTSQDGINFNVDYSTVRQLPLNHNVDKCKLTQLSIGVDGWFLDVPYIEESLLFGKNIYKSTFYSDIGETFVAEGFANSSESGRCSCATYEPSNCPNLDNIPAPSEDADIYLGMGLDSDRDWFKQSACINGTPQQITASDARFYTSLVSDYTSLLERTEIGGSVDVSIKKLFNIHADARYEKVVTQRDYSQAFVLEYDVKLGTQSYELDVMSPLNSTGLNAANGGHCYFRQICGDKYIHQVEHGGTVHVEMNFQFSKSSHKREFNAAINGGLDKKFKICGKCGVEKIIPVSVDLEASIKRLSTTVRKSTTLQITASQTGGYAEDLINAIGTNTLSCSLNKIKNCKKVLDDVVKYIQDKFAPSVRELPAVYGYKMFPYEQIIGVPELLSDVTPEIEQARLDLATEYKQRLTDLDKVRNLLLYNLPPEREQRMEYLQASLEQEIVILSQTGKGCFSDLGNCLAEKCDVFNSLASYDSKELVPGYDPRDGLILDWNFDDCTATDSSWNNKHGSFVKDGPECQEGKVGNAVYFDGKGKSIEIPLDITLPSVAVAFWFNVPKPKTYYPRFFYFDVPKKSYGFAGGVQGTHPAYSKKGRVNSSFSFPGKPVVKAGSLDIPPFDTWNFLVVNANFNTNKFEFWLNGILQGIDDIPTSLALPVFEKLKLGIGKCSGACGGKHLTYLTGSLDEFLFYGRALSNSEIQELYEKR